MKSPIDISQVALPIIVVYAATFVLWALIHPVWCIVDCALSNERSQNSKIVWAICMFCFSFIASFFYGLFVTTSHALRYFTILSIILVAAGFLTLVAVQLQ